MPLVDEPSPPESGSRRVLVAGLAGSALVLAMAAALVMPGGGGKEAEPARPLPELPAAARPAAPAPRAGTPAPAPSARSRARARPKAEPAAPASAAPAAPTTGTLRVESDVAGASVFLDRNYAGTTPVTIPDVAPGSHRLNVSAQGYDGYSEQLDVAAGPADVMVRFKEVKLNETIPVVHKHGIGSCEGKLIADPQGLRYETSHQDRFTIRFSELEAFEVDYVKKNLRLKKRGGKTYNFTDKHPTADALFAFHRDVDKARAKLAEQ